MKFFTYVDWTTEQTQRPYYVGKGNAFRITEEKRNVKHQYVSKKHGLERRIAFETDDESAAFHCEEELIAELHTYIYDPLNNSLACNFTLGGDGVAGINNAKVMQFDGDVLVRTYENIREVAGQFQVDPATLSNALSDRGYLPVQMRQFQWVVTKPSRKQREYVAHKNSQAILELDLITNEVICEHHSITNLLKVLKVSYKTLTLALRCADLKYARALELSTGRKWMFKDPLHCVPRHKKSRTPNNPARAKPVNVLCLRSNEAHEFQSVASAAMFIGVHDNRLLEALHDEKHIDGYHCSFSNNNDASKNGVKRSEEAKLAVSEANGTAIVKLDADGNIVKEFSSYRLAEQFDGFTKRELYNVLSKGVSFTRNGFTWKRQTDLK